MSRPGEPYCCGVPKEACRCLWAVNVLFAIFKTMALHECNVRLPVEQRGMGSAGVLLGAIFDDPELQSLVYDNPNAVVLTSELLAALTSHSSPQV